MNKNLVSDGLKVKLSDFGMSRTLLNEKSDYSPTHSVEVPVRW